MPLPEITEWPDVPRRCVRGDFCRRMREALDDPKSPKVFRRGERPLTLWMWWDRGRTLRAALDWCPFCGADLREIRRSQSEAEARWQRFCRERKL
jgi:hypothetical protein